MDYANILLTHINVNRYLGDAFDISQEGKYEEAIADLIEAKAEIDYLIKLYEEVKK